jgi:hypothetical protein
MTQTLADFIKGRIAELTARQVPLRQELEQIGREIEQLQRAADAADIVVHFPADSGVAAHAQDYTRRSVPEKTIKEAVLHVLNGNQEGLTALDILDLINMRLGVKYPRTSLSPQLSRLKADGRIERVGNVWRITRRLADLIQQPDQPELDDALK